MISFLALDKEPQTGHCNRQLGRGDEGNVPEIPGLQERLGVDHADLHFHDAQVRDALRIPQTCGDPATSEGRSIKTQIKGTAIRRQAEVYLAERLQHSCWSLFIAAPGFRLTVTIFASPTTRYKPSSGWQRTNTNPGPPAASGVVERTTRHKASGRLIRLTHPLDHDRSPI